VGEAVGVVIGTPGGGGGEVVSVVIGTPGGGGAKLWVGLSVPLVGGRSWGWGVCTSVFL